MPTVVIALTSGTRWIVPGDCTKIQVECIGGGAAVSSVGSFLHGASYSKTTSLTVTPGSVVYTNIGTGGGNTWLNISSNAAPTSTTAGCLAAGGGITPSSQNTTSVGNVKYIGGVGGVYDYSPGGCDASYDIGSGGGAAGPNGNGGNGGNLYAGVNLFGGGGGANGGSSGAAEISLGISAAGGNNRFGTGGGAAVSSGNGNPGTNGGGGSSSPAGNGGSGSQEDVWTDYKGVAYGPGGGAGSTVVSGTGVYPTNTGYGNAGRPGLIIITYTANPQTATYSEVYTSSSSNIRIPYGCTQIVAEGIGTGASGTQANTNSVGGGGGAYAKSTITTGLTPNAPAYAQIGTYIDVLDTWFNLSANSAPTSATTGALAKSASGRTGGQSASCIGATVYSGGNGGFGNTTGTQARGGGGGGAAGPSGVGKNGGDGFSYTTSAAGTGGGGGGANGGSSTAGSTGGTTTSGSGGAGNGGTGGGAGVSGTTTGNNGTNGGGGSGGGRGSSSSIVVAGKGSQQNIWTVGGINYGPGGGAGGGGATSSTTQSGAQNPFASTNGYGAGGGSAGIVWGAGRGTGQSWSMKLA